MYTFRQAVEDTKKYYKIDYFHNLLTEMRHKEMTESDIEEGVKSSYKILFRVLFKDKLNHLYKDLNEFNDKILVVEKFAKILVPLTSLYYLTRDYSDIKLQALREQIKDWADIYKTYIMADNVYIGEFNIEEIKEYIDGQNEE